MKTKTSVIPFGPQHPVLPEPLQLKLVMQDERVIEAIPAIGYVHRGLEKLAETKDMNQMIYVVERICGICSFMHALNYCHGIEEMMELQVPDRAKYLRVIWGEMHRTHSHLLWLGLLADSFGFESLFMQAWRARERVMDMMEATAGSRIMISTNIIGGLRRDIPADLQRQVLDMVDEVEREMKEMEQVFLKDYTVKHRLVGVGVLPKDIAYKIGAVGPVGRASGLAQDMRSLNYAAYKELDWETVVENDGDCYARTVVRVREVYQALDLIRQAFAKMPEGDIAVPVKGFPDGEVVTRIEQPRGECLYYLRANGTKNLSRVRVRTPTFANIPPLIHMLPGCQLADVPVIVLSIDPCISCTER
ncbi:MAG: nickel-dependent hydrogenase large subunit [bacterium]